MFEVKITQLYVCPICKKEYRRRGYYLKKHLKQCNAVAYIPKTKCEIVFKRIDEHLLSQALENLISGNFNIQSAENWKIDRKPTVQITEKYKNGTREDYRVVMNELKSKIQTLYI